MYIYILLSIIYMILIFVENKYGDRINKMKWIVLLITPLLIIAALRAPSVGNDTSNYLRSYNLVTQEGFFSVSKSRLEIGYIYFMRIIGVIGLDFFGFQIIVTSMILFSFSRLIVKYSPNYAFSVYFLITSRVFFGIMNTTRQYLAIAILLFALDYLIERKALKFIALVLLASTVHFSAGVFIILYPLSFMSLSPKKIIMYIFIGVMLSINLENIAQLFVSITGRYSTYLGGKYFNVDGKFGIYINLLINTLFFGLAFYARNFLGGSYSGNRQHKTTMIDFNNIHSKKILPQDIFYLSMLLTLIISIIGLNATIVGRFEMYFSVVFIIYIPMLTSTFNKGSFKTLLMTGIILGLFFSFIVVMVYRPNWMNVFPYEWFWNWQMT